MKKYKLTKETIKDGSLKLYRIEALTNFGYIKRGEKGGFIEKEENLSQYGCAWVYGNAKVYGNGRVYDNAEVYGNAGIYGNVRVFDYAKIYGNARVYDNVEIFDSARIYGDAEVYGDAMVYGDAEVYGVAEVCGDAIVCKKIGLTGGRFYHTKDKLEKIELVDTRDGYETLACKPKIENY